jgi:hypothetical protein
LAIAVAYTTPNLGNNPGPAGVRSGEEGMTALVNGLIWFGMFAIPMTIAVLLRRLGRRYGLSDQGDPGQEPDYRRWA